MRSVTYSMGVSLDGYIVGRTATSTGRCPTRRSFASSPTRYERSASTSGTELYETMLYWETADSDHRSTTQCLSGRDLEAAPKGGVLHHAADGYREMPAWPPAAWRRIERLRAEPAEATSRSAARLSPPRRRVGPDRRVPGQGLPGAGWRGIPFFPSASAGWISNSSRPAPSARESSTSATRVAR